MGRFDCTSIISMLKCQCIKYVLLTHICSTAVLCSILFPGHRAETYYITPLL